jgi:hypothetical protein
MTSLGMMLSLPMPAGVGVSTASSFSPLDLSPALWLDASDESTLSGPGGGAVSQWSDKSGNGNNVIQNTSADQPKTGIRTLNGMNVLDFDGTTQHLVGPLSVTPTASTAFIVFGNDVDATDPVLVLAPSSGNDWNSVNGAVFDTGTAGHIFEVVHRHIGTDRAHIPGSRPTPPGVYAGRIDSVDVEAFAFTQDQTDAGIGYGGSGTCSQVLISGRYLSGAINSSLALDGAVAEVLVFDSILSDTDMNKVADYLTEKWVPVPLRVGATAWFDASDTESITQSGGLVSQWSDLSGNGYDVAQATSANQPTTGSRTLNGLNVLDFDGSSDYLQGAFGVTLTQPNTIFAVFKRDSAGTMFLYDGIDSSNRHAQYFSSGNYKAFAGTTINGGTVDTDPHISRAVFNGSSSSLFIDGSSVVAGDAGALSLNGITLGAQYTAANVLDGAIAELIVVDGTLTADEITLVENYLTEKWITPVPEALGAALWLDASDTSTIVETSGSVSEWQDKSGNGYDLVQGTTSYQPTTGTRTLNSLNVLDFDNDNMENASVAAGSEFVVFIVADDDAISGTARYHMTGLTSATPIVGIVSGTDYRIYQGTTLDQGTATTGPKLWRAVFTDTTDTLHIDGTLEVSGNAGTNSMAGLRIGSAGGSTYSIYGAIAEIAVFDGTLTDAEIAQMEAYLNDKWGIQPIPLQVGATAWFDASDPYTIIETSGSVSEWRDKSGNGYHVTQGTATNQPTTGSRTQNGLNVLEFISGGDYLDGGDILDLGTNSFSSFTVVKWDDALPASPWGKHIAGSTDGRYGLYRTSTTLNSQYDPDAGNTGTVTYADTDTTTRLITTVLDRNGASSSHVLRIDGAVVATKAFTDPGTSWDTSAPWRVGRYGTSTSFDFDGVIGEIVLLFKTATADEISRVENYLANKWGIAL